MNAIKEMIFSGNIVAWVILIVVLIVSMKVLKSVGKGLLLFGTFCAVVFLIVKFFPGIAEPIADFIRGGWLEENRPQ